MQPRKTVTSKTNASKKLIDIASEFPVLPALSEQNFDIPNQTSVKPNYDITHQFPKYFREKDSSNSNDLFIDFLQSYYNWLYSRDDGSGYPLEYEQINKLMAGETNDFSEIKHFVFSYLSGFPTNKLNSDNIDVTNLIDFLKSIRTQFYHFKGKEQSFVHFFNSLYGVTAEDIKVDEPKTKVMRLNGGRFADWKAALGSTGSYEDISSLGGSYLNYSVFRDGYYYQDYAYSVKTGKDPMEYSDVMYEVLHPSGLLPFFETSIADYIPGETDSDPDADTDTIENPILYNYFAYNVGSTSDLEPCAGCLNSSYNTETHPPDGTTADQPTFAHPGWAFCSEEIIVDGKLYYDCDFGDINISEFFYLSGSGNPNENALSCEELDCPRVTI